MVKRVSKQLSRGEPMLKSKKYLKLKKSESGYDYVETNDDGLGTLYFFLDECWHFGVSTFKELINDPTVEGGGGNITLWEREGNKIIIIFAFPRDDEDPYKDAFEATIEELNCILDQWEELLKKMPKEIIMIRDDMIQNDSPVILKENKLISKQQE